MQTTWSRPITIKKAYDEAPKKPGIYVIRRNTAVERIGGKDSSGVLYIGKTVALQRRLRQFWNADHIASWLLLSQRAIASHILEIDCKKEEFLYKKLGNLSVRMAEITDDKDLEGAERAVLFAYALKFGELPPLNANFSKRSEELPCKEDLEWGRKGIK